MSETATHSGPIPPDLAFQLVGSNATNAGLETAITDQMIYVRGSYDTEFNSLPGDLFDLGAFMEASPAVAQYLGYSLDVKPDGIELQAPNVSVLNEKKKILTEVAGVNNGPFVATRSDIIPLREYVSYFAEGKIPVSQAARGAVHDSAAHIPGFAVMSQTTFDTLVKEARKAVASQKEAHLESALRLIDGISATMTRFGGHSGPDVLGSLYRQYTSGLLIGSRAQRNGKAQIETMAKIQQFLA